MDQNRTVKFLIYSSFVYILLGMTLGFLVALKMIWPSIADFEFLTFGRVRTAHTNVILFGWLFQASLGLLHYILPKLLHTRLFSEKIGLLMWAVFNTAAIGGVISILNGNMKAIEYGELPSPFDYMIVVCWVLFAVNVVGTIINSRVKYFYVSVWYIIGTVIWTTFVYITGNIITQLPFVTGINQANIQWFYVHNAVGLIFTPMGLATAYYFIPKQLETPLYSHRLSLVGFWVISFVYVWTGAHHMIHGPISYWLQTVAILFSWSLIIPVVAVITNFFGTFGNAPKEKRIAGAIPKFLLCGTVYYLLTCLQGPFQAIRTINKIVSKTDWVVGHAHMAVFGAFTFFAIAGIYYVIPVISKKKLYSEKLANLHFWLTFGSSIPFFAALWLGGIIQGFVWQNIEITFIESLKMMSPYHVIRMLSGSIILIAQVIFIYNIWETIAGKGKSTETPGQEAVV